ncbi:fimbrial protein [Huaxiibacter chinensis]
MKKSLLAACLFMSVTSLAEASNGTIKFDGTIRDTACSIDASNLDQSVSFGDIAKSLINQGGRSNPEMINIKLKNCSQGTLKEIQTTLNGSPAGFSEAFGVSGVSNVGILIEQSGTIVKPNSSVKQALRNGDNTISFQASVVGDSATGKDVTEGTFSSTVNFAIDYL